MTDSALLLMADIVVRPSTPAPQAMLPQHVATSPLPFVVLAVVAVAFLWYLRKRHTSRRAAIAPSDKG